MVFMQAEILKKGEMIFKGEGRSQRIITKRFVEKNWNEDEKMHFRRYAYPVSDELFILWDDDPSEWAPQNHSCEPNTIFDGLNVLSLQDITENEELTLDYAQFLDENMEPFQCQCGTVFLQRFSRRSPRKLLNFEGTNPNPFKLTHLLTVLLSFH